MTDDPRQSPPPDEPTLVSRRPEVPDAIPLRDEPTHPGSAPRPQLTTDTDELELPPVERTRLDARSSPPRDAPVRQDTVVERPRPSSTADRDALEFPRESAVDAFGREVERFGAGVAGVFGKLFRALRNGWRPVREQAVATWSRIRGVQVKEFEQRGEDTFDRERAKKWESFNRGRTSSSYLQDTERRHR